MFWFQNISSTKQKKKFKMQQVTRYKSEETLKNGEKNNQN